MKYQKKNLQNFQPHWKIAWSVLSGCFFFPWLVQFAQFATSFTMFFLTLSTSIRGSSESQPSQLRVLNCFVWTRPIKDRFMWRKKTCLKHWDRLFFWLVDSEFSNVEAYLLSTRFVLTEAVLQPTVFYTNEDAEAGCVCGIHWHDLWF